MTTYAIYTVSVNKWMSSTDFTMFWPLSFAAFWLSHMFGTEPTTPKTPSSQAQDTTVILGGGVIGLSTAYYMAKDQLAESNHLSRIVVLDSETELFLGASGGGTGIVGNYGFKPEVAKLGALSWKLLKNLNEEFNGRSNFGWSDIVVRSVSFQDDAPPGYGKVVDRPVPLWFKNVTGYHYHWISGPDLTARIDSLKFCKWLREKVESLGVQIITGAIAQGLSINDHTEPQTFSINYKHGTRTKAMEFANLVISAGPWSQRVLSTLFPSSEISIPFDLAHAAGNYLLVKTPRWKPKDDEAGCDQLYLDGVLNHTLDISSYLSGTLYVGGYGGETEDLPEFAGDVKAQPASVAAMMDLCVKALDLTKDEALEVISAGRCYRPVVKMRRPIITQLPLKRLMGPQKVPSNIKGSFFLNTGHGSNGITLGPGSGKVMSDLVAGRRPAVDVSRLGLSELEKG